MQIECGDGTLLGNLRAAAVLAEMDQKPKAAKLFQDAAERIDKLEDALRRVVRDVNDHEAANNLHPNPGRAECWDSVAHAKAVLAGSI